MRSFATAGVFLAAVLGTVGARADEGRIPIFKPTTITQAGHYILTRDISAASGPMLIIQADHVTLDLNGRLVSSSGTTSNLVQIADGFRDITVRNGRLRGGNTGVIFFSTTQRTRLSLETLEISGSASAGIFVQGAEHVDVRSCRVRDSHNAGIVVIGYSDVFSGRFTDNSIEFPASNGLHLSDLRDGEISGNVITLQERGGIGIDLTGASPLAGGNLVQRNVVSIPGGVQVTGIMIESVSNHNLVQLNVVQGATLRGMVIAGSENRVVRNLVAKTTGDGFFVQGARNLLDGNQAEGNTGCGIDFITNTAHAWRNNMLRGNGAGLEVCNGAGGNTNAGGNICDAGFCP